MATRGGWLVRGLPAAGVLAWALAGGGVGCGEPGAAPAVPSACVGDRVLLWEDPAGVLHPEATWPLEAGNRYRCAAPGPALDCASGQPYRQDVIRHLHPGRIPGELVRCVGPAFRA